MIGVRKLPPQDSPDGQDAERRYRNREYNYLMQKYGYSSIDSLQGAFRKLYNIRLTGFRIPPSDGVEPKPKPDIIEILPAPVIKIQPIKQEVRRGQGEEVHLQEISDAHVGLITTTFNSQVFKQRLETLQAGIIKLCLLHRKMRPIKKLVTPFLGDLTHGEQYGVQGYVEEFEMGVEEQIYELLVPEFCNFYVNLLQVYEEIEVDGVPGNHGNIERRREKKSQRSNWDTIFYRALKQALSKYSRIKFNIPPIGQWYMVKEVNGWNFLLIHGDQIISYQGVPFYGLERKGLRWKQSIGVDEPFDFILTAHVHNPNFLWNAGIPTYVNGCFITDSNFPLVRMGLRDVPQQWSMFVNRNYGVTASYRIQLDKKKG